MFPQEAGQVLTIDVNDLTLHDNSASGYPRCPSLPDPFSRMFLSMTVLVRSSCLSGLDELAAGLGLQLPLLLRRFGLPPEAATDPDLPVSYQAFINLLEHCAQAGRCPDLGLRLAQRQGIGVLGPIAVLLRHAATVGEALALASRYLFVHSPALRLQIDPVPGRAHEVDVLFALDGAALTPRPQAISLSLGIICHSLRALTDGQAQPVQVSLPHLPVAAPGSYRQAYGCAVVFGASAAAVRLASADLALVLSEHDPQIKALALGYLEQLAGSAHTPVSSQVRGLLRGLLGSGSTGHEELARALSMHPRTLQRRLHSEGTTFARLLDEVRRSQFEALIAMPVGPGLTQIAHILGYAEASVLTRSCQRWFGVAPSRLKKPLLPGGSAGGQGEREAQEVQEVQEVQQEQGAGTTASHGG